MAAIHDVLLRTRIVLENPDRTPIRLVAQHPAPRNGPAASQAGCPAANCPTPDEPAVQTGSLEFVRSPWSGALEPATDEPGAFIIDGDRPVGEIVEDCPLDHPKDRIPHVRRQFRPRTDDRFELWRE